MIDKLEFLIALARERNFSRAAESCGVTQPTLSAGIKQVEDTLGVLLVNRSSRFYGLTAEGERVLEWGRRIVETRAPCARTFGPQRRRLPGNRRPDRALHSRGTDDSFPGEVSRRALHGLIKNVERNPIDAWRFSNRRGPHLS
jgi:Bacterial regulatory helix-turn-helix protein, lysR family